MPGKRARFRLSGVTAVITGASSGLGAEFARQLAPHAAALVLVARREAEMNELAESLRRDRPALRVAVVVCDLADAGSRERLPGHLASLGFRVNLLVNNAGLGDYGEFATGAWHRLAAVMEVNMVALTHLAHVFVADLETSGPSGMLNVSSLAGELPIPDFGVYAATKAYVTRLSEALRIELRGRGIFVSVLAPGPVATGFGGVARRGSESLGQPKWSYVDKEKVVRLGLEALVRGRAVVYPGVVPTVAAWVFNALPRVVLRAMLWRRPRKAADQP